MDFNKHNPVVILPILFLIGYHPFPLRCHSVQCGDLAKDPPVKRHAGYFIYNYWFSLTFLAL